MGKTPKVHHLHHLHHAVRQTLPDQRMQRKYCWAPDQRVPEVLEEVLKNVVDFVLDGRATEPLSGGTRSPWA
jgi:hypothetical protein